jgi:4-amino-4-deoxy-L-arabinose transferase-like glycosyltransferase
MRKPYNRAMPRRPASSLERPVPRALWILLALLFLVPRCTVIALHMGRPLSGDELSYNQIARNVAEGRGFTAGQDAEVRRPTAARGPAYVLLVAAFDRVFGDDHTPLFAFQVLLDALSLLLLVRLAKRWFDSWWIAWLAGLLYATYPPIVSATAAVLTETMTQLTLLLWVTWFFDYLAQRRPRDLILAGVALGVCALSKPHLALFGPVACLAALPQLRFAGAARALAIVVAVVVLTMAPWIVRNALVFHEFVPGVSIGGMGIWFGSGAFNGRTVGSLDHAAVPDSVRKKVYAMGELEANRYATKEAIRVVREDPASYLKLSCLKVLRLWFNLGFDEGKPSRASIVLAIFNLGVIALAFVGARLAVDPVAPRLLAFGALYWTLVHIPFFANVRYAVPFYALVFAFTGAGVVVLVRAYRGSRAI